MITTKTLCKMIMVLSFPFVAHSQQPNLTSLDQLYNRAAQGSDTVYVINFWATWCVPCLKELLSFEMLHTRFGKEKLKVLLVNVDFKTRQQTIVLPFLKKRKFQTEVCLLDEPNQEAFINRVDTAWSGAIPATLFMQGSKRRFYEAEFTYPQLAAAYQTFKQ